MRVGLPSDARRATVVVLTAVMAAVSVGCADDGGSESAGGTAAERAFLSAMVPHHESAVEMALIARGRAVHAELRELAHGIVSTQQLEIRRMKQIHKRLFGERLVPDERAHEELGLSAADAGMTHGDMARLEDARRFDRAFIDAMIPHHAGAIRMARAVMARDMDDEIRDLADGIVRAQSQEIEELNEWRIEWYGKEAPAEGVPEAGEDGGSSGEAPHH